MRVARLARVLERQGFVVVVSTICPYRELRRKVKEITGCLMICLVGGEPPGEERPFEPPGDEVDIVLERSKIRPRWGAGVEVGKTWQGGEK